MVNGLSIIYIFKLCNAVMLCHCEPIESYCTIQLALMVPRCDGLTHKCMNPPVNDFLNYNMILACSIQLCYPYNACIQ